VGVRSRGAGARRGAGVERAFDLSGYALGVVEGMEGPAAGDLDEPRVAEGPAQPTGEVELEEAVRVAPEEQDRLLEARQACGDVQQLVLIDTLQKRASASAVPSGLWRCDQP
jgi:hypothetical protein